MTLSYGKNFEFIIKVKTMENLKIKTMGYSRVFSLGNYENEKISVEADIPDGADTTDVYIELKKVVENAHNLRSELRDYANAQKIVSNPDYYRGAEVKAAKETISNFETKYPKLLDVKTHALLSENGDSLSDDNDQINY
jgi:hypothetical protein